ncbi:MAG: hypothetical protein ABL953_10045 [Ilumatobacteraceae bacterium]
MDDHCFDDFVDQQLALAVVGFVPDGVDVDGLQERSDLLEVVSENALSFDFVQSLLGLALDGLNLPSESRLFFVEHRACDLVGVVQVE